MARCPHCGQGLTSEELGSGACICSTVMDRPRKRPAPESGAIRDLWPALAGGVIVALILALALLLNWVPAISPPAVAPAPTAPARGATPTPTRNTAVPLDPIVSQALVAPQVYDHDALDEFIETRWYASEASVALTDAGLRITGVEPWASWWGTRRTFEGGDAVLVRFRPDPGSQFEFHLERGTWATGDYRRWAFHVGTRFEMSIIEGADPQRWGELVGQLSPQSESWYSLLLGMDPHGEFLAYLWEDRSTEPHLTYRKQMDETWHGAGWIFGAGANRGAVDVASVTEIAFVRVDPPDGADAHFWRALALADQGNAEAALEALDAALRLEPDNATYLYYRGLTHCDLGQLSEALADLERASELDPDNDEYHRQLAWLHARERGSPIRAQIHIEYALSLAPFEARNYRLRALILRDVQHDWAAALVDFTNAIELAPREAELYRLRGETWNLMGDYATGLEDALQCAELQPEDAACYLQQARSHIGLDDPERAVAAYTLFLETTEREVCPGCREEAEAYIAQHR